MFVLGLCTFGTNAVYAGYTDIAKITEEYMDAVEVLSGLDVIEGYPDGSFVPGGDVTRAEAAAMIARMMLGRDGADRLPIGDVKFSDVPETNWAAKYIAFCANKGIIVGMGDGTFRPNDNVTGTQLATMLLRALGYGVIGEYEGKGWDINAVADALYYKVFDDSLVTDFNQPATREETALYIWNTMRIQLVGYDVDLNYYDGKVERIDRDTYIPITFARDVFNLWEINYENFDDEPLVLLANKETGSKYTVVGTFEQTEVWDYDEGKYVVDEEGWSPKYYLDYETTKDLVGHEVTIYIDADPKEDTREHLKYYKCYLIKDESELLEKGDKLDDFYRNAKAANADNVNVKFANVKTMRNYDYTDIGYVGEDVTDGDTLAPYAKVSELKGQKSSGDSAPRNTWVLDHEGNIMLVLKEKYYVGQVQNVDNDHEEVEVKYCYDTKTDKVTFAKTRFYDTEIFDMAWNDVELVYDGIAEDDYVVVRPVGSLVYIEATTTEDVDVTQRDLFIFWYYFNGYTIAPDINVVGTFEVEGEEEPYMVNPGDKVRFYKTSSGYFSVEVLERAKTEGVVYVVYIDEFIEHSEWDSDYTDPTMVTKVQCINQDGEEVVYKYSKNAWAKLAPNLKPVVGSVFEVRKTGSSYVFDPNVRNLIKLTNDSGKTSFLKSKSDTYYVESDTKVIYFDETAKGKDLALTIEVANKLSKDTGYVVYAIAKKSGGSYKLETCWVPEGVTAPDNYDADSIIYVGGTRSYSGSANYKIYNDENTPYYNVFKDGVFTTSVFLTGGPEIYSYGDTILSDFYYYADSDDDGILELTKAKKVNKGVVLGKDADGMVEDGRLFVDIASGKTEGLTLKNDIIDISGGTTTYTKTDAAVSSVARLEKLLEEGYKITIDYMYTVSDGEQIPVGNIYVTSVDASGAKK